MSNEKYFNSRGICRDMGCIETTRVDVTPRARKVTGGLARQISDVKMNRWIDVWKQPRYFRNKVKLSSSVHNGLCSMYGKMLQKKLGCARGSLFFCLPHSRFLALDTGIALGKLVQLL